MSVEGRNHALPTAVKRRLDEGRTTYPKHWPCYNKCDCFGQLSCGRLCVFKVNHRWRYFLQALLKVLVYASAGVAFKCACKT